MSRSVVCIVLLGLSFLAISACQNTRPRHGATSGRAQPVMSVADGMAVAARLNARYSATPIECQNNRPAYFCSGVLYRAIMWDRLYYFWNNRQRPDYDGVSFSYWREDVGVRTAYLTVGYILAPAEAWGGEQGVPRQMYCSFAFDGWTGADRGSHGCDEHRNFPVESRPCLDARRTGSQKIDSIRKFAVHYGAIDSSRPSADRWQHSCSFGEPGTVMQPSVFLLSIHVRQRGAIEPGGKYTEQVISNWGLDEPERLPVEAIFIYDNASDTFRGDAKAHQADYFEATGRLVPIVRYTTDLTKDMFTYCRNDQGPPTDPRYIRARGTSPSGYAPLNMHDMPVPDPTPGAWLECRNDE